MKVRLKTTSLTWEINEINILRLLEISGVPEWWICNMFGLVGVRFWQFWWFTQSINFHARYVTFFFSLSKLLRSRRGDHNHGINKFVVHRYNKLWMESFRQRLPNANNHADVFGIQYRSNCCGYTLGRARTVFQYWGKCIKLFIFLSELSNSIIFIFSL